VTSKKKAIAAKHFLCTKMTFSQSLMVSVGMSKLDYIGVIFISAGVKMNEFQLLWRASITNVAACFASVLWPVHTSVS